MPATKDPIKYQEWIEKLSGREPWNKNVQVGHCLNCEQEFHFSPSRKGLRKYCSTKCVLDAHRITVRCKNCGKEFLAPKSRAGRIAFCSEKCYGIHREQHPEQYPPPPLRGRSIEVECGYCGKTFRTKMAHHLNGRGRFCSKKCYGKYVRSHPELYGGSNHWNWKGGISEENHQLRRSEEYKEWRDAVFRRDNWTCQNPECGYKGHKIVAHHIKDFEEYPELRYDVDNGQTLCRACHKKLHYGIGERRQFKAGQYPWNKLPVPAREELEELYWGWGLSTVDIARTFGTSHRTVRKWLRHYNIPIRSLSEARRNLFNNQHYLPLWERETRDESRILEKMQAKQGA